MDRNIQTDHGQRSSTGGTILQVDGAGDSKKGKKKAGTTKKGGIPKRGTPKKGGGDGKRSVSATPTRKGGRRRGVARVADATTLDVSTRSAATPEGMPYNITVTNQKVTDATDIYEGPPGGVYLTLRRQRSQRFKALLQQLENPSRQLESQLVGITTVQSPIRPSIAEPSLVGLSTEHFATAQSGTRPSITDLSIGGPSVTAPPITEPSIRASSTVSEESRESSHTHAKPSPADSGVDILTPDTIVRPVTSDSEQSAHSVRGMAPVREITQEEKDRLRERNRQVEAVSDSLKDVIHNYYEIQTQVQGYVSEAETRDVLVNKVHELSQSLARLSQESSSNTITNTFVPPEVVDYVDDGRNPDIYTRELVEVVQRGNAVLNGKMNAFGSFSKIFADDLRKMSPEMAKAVDEIMGVDESEVHVKQEENGGSRQT